MTRDKDCMHAVLNLLVLALRLEGEGQSNLAKLARAAVYSLDRQLAMERSGWFAPICRSRSPHIYTYWSW